MTEKNNEKIVKNNEKIVKKPDVVIANDNAYDGDVDPTQLDVSNVHYTHIGSPAHKAWLKKKGL